MHYRLGIWYDLVVKALISEIQLCVGSLVACSCIVSVTAVTAAIAILPSVNDLDNILVAKRLQYTTERVKWMCIPTFENKGGWSGRLHMCERCCTYILPEVYFGVNEAFWIHAFHAFAIPSNGTELKEKKIGTHNESHKL